VWLGYQQSLRPCQTGLLLNMDIAATAFIEPMDVIPYILNAVGRGASIDRLNPMQLKKAARAIKGVQVSSAIFSWVPHKQYLAQYSRDSEAHD